MKGLKALVQPIYINQLRFPFFRFFPLQKRDPFPPLSKMMNMKSVGLQVLWILWLPIRLPSQVSPVLIVGCDVPRDGHLLSPLSGGNLLLSRHSAASSPSSRHLWKAGSVTMYTLPSIGPSHQLQGLVARNWLGFAKRPHLVEARLARRPSCSRVPNLTSLLWHAMFPLFIPK